MTVFCGTAFHTPERHKLEVLQDALLVVNDVTGKLDRVLLPSESDYHSVKAQADVEGKLVTLRPHQYLIPGLIDLHVHAPQWPQAGKALHLPLEVWLQEKTFPLESKYEDVGFAEEVYTSLVDTLLSNGTTTAVYFATVHVESSLKLANVCLQKGQRAVVGRVAMDVHKMCPDFYRDASAADSIEKTAIFVEAVKKLEGNDSGLVLPSVVPRFVPTCSEEALLGLGKLAHKYNCHVQTHCSESDWEHNYVIEHFKKHDTFLLDDMGLLTRRTILAHSNFVSTEDMDLIAARGSAVAHCSLSNFYYSNAVFPLKKALDKNVRVGLGTDLSGGHSPSIFDACRYTVAASRALDDGVDPSKSAKERSNWKGSRVDFIEAFWMATTQGGVSLDLNIGMFTPGYAFDSLVIDADASGTNVRVFDSEDSLEDVFQKIVYNATPANIFQTWVNGKLVHQLRAQ